MTASGISFAFPWEVSLMEWLQNSVGSTGIAVISFLSVFGEEYTMVLMLGFLFWCYDKKMARYVGYCVLMSVIWNPMIKNLVLRRRPYFDHESIRILRLVEPKADAYDIAAQGYSFPSLHSTCVTSLYGAAARYLKKPFFTFLAFLLPLLVGFSRITVGAHYPTDVLAGWLIGILALVLVPWVLGRLKKRWLFYAVMLLTVLPGFFFCRSADFFSTSGLFFGLMAGDAVESRWVNFENTRNPLRIFLRLTGGLAVFLVMNVLLKLPLSAAFPDSGSLPALLARCVRYAVIGFVEFAVYPMLFGKIPWKKTKSEASSKTA